jgi:hypothetical protein
LLELCFIAHNAKIAVRSRCFIAHNAKIAVRSLFRPF